MKIKIDKNYIEKRLSGLGIDPSIVFEKYAEKHRFYHNLDHIINMFDYCYLFPDSFENDNLFLAIVFHDIIYDPKCKDNEEKSVEFYNQHYNKDAFIDHQLVRNLILATKDHNDQNRVKPLYEHIIRADLNTLSSGKDMMEYEDKIFKEYQYLDYEDYKKGRLKFLTQYEDWILDFKERYNYVKNRKIKIGIYPGSFTPFTVGHLNILEKSERIFDKVIVAYGNNPEKPYSQKDIPLELFYRETIIFDGLLTDLIDKYNQTGYDITVIRGMRNATDFQYELNQYRWLQELKPDIKVVSIFCDKEYEHISSSAIRTIEKFGKTTNYKVK